VNTQRWSKDRQVPHDQHLRTSGNGEQPTFEDEPGRAIAANQPHAPPR
jgi:hypothetical protein